MCGEKMMKAGSNCAMLGSPPRMRGKVVAVEERDHHLGITPAYAGKRSGSRGIQGGQRDHPRVCGEKSGAALRGSAAMGSPPRMRGKGIQQGDCWVTVGITPAYAGKSQRPVIGHILA